MILRWFSLLCEEICLFFAELWRLFAHFYQRFCLLLTLNCNLLMIRPFALLPSFVKEPFLRKWCWLNIKYIDAIQIKWTQNTWLTKFVNVKLKAVQFEAAGTITQIVQILELFSHPCSHEMGKFLTSGVVTVLHCLLLISIYFHFLISIYLLC